MGGRLGANPCTNHMQKVLSLFKKGPLALVAGENLNPRPLGYEPYDACLWRPEQSLAGVVTSADRTAPSRSVGLRLPRLVLSRRVRFTNRFTEQAIDLQFHAPSAPFRGCRPWARGTVSGLGKRLPGGAASTRDASPTVVPDARLHGAQSPSPLPGLHRGTDHTRCLSSPYPEPGCCRT